MSSIRAGYRQAALQGASAFPLRACEHREPVLRAAVNDRHRAEITVTISLQKIYISFHIGIRIAIPAYPSPILNKLNTVAIGSLANLPAVIDSLGFDGGALMQEFGIETSTFVRPLQPVPIALCGEVLHRAVAFTRCDSLPLLLGSKARMENLGPLRLLVASSRQVRDAVNALIRFRKVWFPGFQISIAEERGIASMTIDVPGTFLGHQLLSTSFLTALERHMEIIIGRPWKLGQVHMARPKPDDTTPYRKFFGVLPSFSQPRDALFFDAALLAMKRQPTHDPDLNAYFRKQLLAMEEALGSSFSEQVSELIETLLMGGGCDVEKVAEIFGMHRLTLYRRLRAYGTSFESLLDARRRAMAEAMLRRNAISVAEIADALGYATPASFIRAFRRWTGRPPTAWRNSSANAGGARGAS